MLQAQDTLTSNMAALTMGGAQQQQQMQPLNPYLSLLHQSYYPSGGQGMFNSSPAASASFTPGSPWGSSRSSINPAAAGLGRQAELPQPIGAQRPMSNGNASTFSPTSATGRSQDAFGDYARQYRQQTPESVAFDPDVGRLRHTRNLSNMRSIASGEERGEQRSNTTASTSGAAVPQTANTWVRRSSNDARVQEQGYAEEMSRER